jgi:nucleotide-binding universal stress UspA family protein
MFYTHILAPIDFSDSENHALDYAFKEAEHQHAKLTLLHVVHHHPYTKVYYVKDTLADRKV